MKPHQAATGTDGEACEPLTPYGKRIRAIPVDWAGSFGKEYYLHEKSIAELNAQSESDWKLRLEGQLIDTGHKINVTSYDEMKRYIQQELEGINTEEVYDE